ncbi:MAG: hypothetical protein IKU37_01415 [Candidatus Gastranaerophilales bacterium]|nr:hypothetical protein [Candidatus Gastranaerophilales bacterium]
MQNKEEKYYVRSNGEKVSLSTIDTTHLKNAMAKKMEDLFYTNSKDEFAEKLKEVNDLKDEYYKRINKHYEELKD